MSETLYRSPATGDTSRAIDPDGEKDRVMTITHIVEIVGLVAVVYATAPEGGTVQAMVHLREITPAA